jgi:thimet oligopeptidase
VVVPQFPTEEVVTFKRITFLAAACALVVAVPAISATATKTASKAAASDGPFWAGKPTAAAFEKTQRDRMAKAKEQIAKLSAVTGKRTLENTLRVYDDALVQLDMVASQSSLIENVHPDSSLRDAAEKMSQEASALGTEISLDRRVYDALSAIPLDGLDAPTTHYIKTTLRDFKLAGVDRDDATRAKVKALNDELVVLGQHFQKNISTDKRPTAFDPADLEGLPADYIARHKPGADGKVILTMDYPDATPMFTYAKSEAARKKLYMEYNNRAFPANVEVLNNLIAKRHELATTLGFANWADYVTANKMIGNGRNASDFIDQIVAASTDRATADLAQLLARKKKDTPDATVINAWETNYYSEQVRRTDYNFDQQSLRPYLPYKQVKQGVLDISAKLFNVQFKQVKDAPVWDPSVDCYEMYEGGKLVGRFYLDMHPRANKYNHAAQFDVRTGLVNRQIPEAALVCNFPGGDANDPGLMEFGDVKTFFHEFGHLLHTLFAGRGTWVGISGIRTEQDFVEAPSQMLEEWMIDPPTLQTFAKHYQTGQPVPTEMVMQMKRANDFGKGLGVRRQMVLARTSLSIYNQDPAQVNVDQIIKDATAKYVPYPFVEGTHFQCAFGHLNGYSAVYYTYMWSLVIAKDMFSKFDKRNLMDPTVAAEYRRAVLAPGASKPAAELVKDFLGRPYGFDSYKAWLNEVN